MAIAMTVGATKIQILHQNSLASVDLEKPKEEETASAETPVEGQACGT